MQRLILIVILAAFLVSCGDDEARPQWNPGGPAVCEAGPSAPRYRVERLNSIGPGANVIVDRGDDLLVVESLQNTVSAFELSDQSYRQIADVRENSNPYDIAFDDDRFWVSNYLSGTVDEFDAGGRVRQIETGLRNPGGLAFDGQRIWVTDINFLNPSEGFGTGRIALFSEDGAHLQTVELDVENVQFARAETLDQTDYMFAVATGAIEFIDGEPAVTSASRVYRWPADAELDELNSPEVASLEVPQPARVAGLGQMHRKPGSNLAYIASGVAPLVYVLNLETMEWVRGLENPIEVYQTSNEALHHGGFDERGIFYLTAFNQDALYLVDTRCDAVLAGPIDLGQNADLLEGPHGIIARDSSAYFVMGLSNTLGRVRFEW